MWTKNLTDTLPNTIFDSDPCLNQAAWWLQVTITRVALAYLEPPGEGEEGTAKKHLAPGHESRHQEIGTGLERNAQNRDACRTPVYGRQHQEIGTDLERNAQ